MSTERQRSGPLAGLRVVEMAGLGPAPFAAMVLADLGADVLRITRPGVAPDAADVTGRSRRTLALDLREPAGREAALSLIAKADVLLEGFRPGVMERLGLGPERCTAEQPRLVYGRMTGWGQSGPLAATAGHDLNYIAVAGALHAIGRPGAPPVPPLNYVGDFGGGAMLLVAGVLAALLERERSGRGQVIDAAMTDGTALLSAFLYGWRAQGRWPHSPGHNLLDGGAPYYDCYACADGRHLAVAPLEPQFYRVLLERLGLLDEPLLAVQDDPARWPAQKARLAAIFATRTRDDWCGVFEGSDACVAPVLDWDEAAAHPHNAAREAHVVIDGVLQPAPAPRFSRTPPGMPKSVVGCSLDEARAAWA